jgi:KRAB domain-containing zinc finger protein
MWKSLCSSMKAWNNSKWSKILYVYAMWKDFYLWKLLKKHKLSHTTEKCSIYQQWGKYFLYVSSLHSHAMTHSGEKLYVCMQCGKAFSSSTYFEIRKRTHTGEKHYKQCGKVFVSSSHFQAHEQCHHDESPYVGEKCGKAFIRYSSFW